MARNTVNLMKTTNTKTTARLAAATMTTILLASGARIAWGGQAEVPANASDPGTSEVDPADVPAATSTSSDEDGFTAAAGDVSDRLEASLDELDALRRTIADETLPMTRRLAALEAELASVKGEFQGRVRELDGRSLDLANLQKEIDARAAEATYLSGLLGEYQRNFESRLHITELQRYAEPLETARLAAENTALSDQEVSAAQATLLLESLERLHDVAGGTTFG
ncbi:MAG: hypothetical protein ACO3YY_09215, partial [Phycisphaerales bacterium]